MLMFRRWMISRQNINKILLKSSYKWSNTNKKLSQLQSMRNKDYASLRKHHISQYNAALLQQRQAYNTAIQKIKTQKVKTSRNSERNVDIEDEINIKIDLYRNKILQISKKLKKQLKQIDEQQKTNTVKLYLADHLKDNLKSVHQSHQAPEAKGFHIPNKFIIKKLYLCGKQHSKNANASQQLLLAGVQSDDNHCLFLAKLIQQFDIKNVVTMVPPDLPFFLKTEDSFLTQWKKFIQNSDYAKKVKFFVNPKPKTLQQICLHSHHSPIVRTSLSRSRAFLDTHYYLMQQNQLNGVFQPKPLLSGICSQNVQKVYMADYPVFQQRKMLADNISLQSLRFLFQQHLKNIRQMKLNFSAQWLFPKQVLRKKLSHFLGVARAVTEKGQGRTMMICPAEIAELVGIEWELGNKQGRLRFNHQDGQHYLNLADVSEQIGEQTFIQYVQKLVILDLIIQPVITKYFVRYKSFPFLCHHTIGGKQNIGKIFIVWMHFYTAYYEALTEKRLSSESQSKLKNQYFNKFDHPTDFT